MSAEVPQDTKPALGIRGPIMFWITTLWVMILGLLLHRHLQFDAADTAFDVPETHLEKQFAEHQTELVSVGGLYLILYFLILGEAFLRVRNRDPQRRSLWVALLQLLGIAVMPAFRLAFRDEKTFQYYWFPGLGWRYVEKQLRKDLERIFSIPMVLIALMVLPLFGIEYYWEETVKQSESLATTLVIGNSIVWFAFAFEFLVMLSVAKNVMRFLVTQWINIFIIVLPIVQAAGTALPLLRLTRLSRLLRLSKVTRMGRVYRLRGLAMRAWRAILVLEVIQRLFGGSLEKRLDNLEALLDAKKEEIDELKEEIREVRERMAERDGEGLGVLSKWRANARTSICSTADSIH